MTSSSTPRPLMTGKLLSRYATSSSCHSLKDLTDLFAFCQLETAAGAAIKHFKNGHGVNVPRTRFLPVKSCSDLLLIKSDIYSLEHGQLVINEQRMFETTPVIKLGDHFKKVIFYCSERGRLSDFRS